VLGDTACGGGDGWRAAELVLMGYSLLPLCSRLCALSRTSDLCCQPGTGLILQLSIATQMSMYSDVPRTVVLHAPVHFYFAFSTLSIRDCVVLIASSVLGVLLPAALRDLDELIPPWDVQGLRVFAWRLA